MSAQPPDCMIGPSEPCAGYQELRAELDTAIRRAEALAVVLRDARAAIAPPSVVFAAGYPLPAHLRMTAERAQLLGRIDAAIDAARGDKP